MRKPKPLANTFLTHLSRRGLADKRYEVKRYKSADGDIRPVATAETGKRKGKRMTASRKAVREMRPARDELIVCNGLKVPGNGLQIWGEHLVWARMLCR